MTERGSGQQPTAEAGNACLARDARQWLTPHGFANTDASGKTAGAAGEMAKQATEWGTPTSHERTHEPRDVDHGKQLANQTAIWPTPRSEDSEQSGARLSRGTEDTLTATSRSFPLDPPTLNLGDVSSPSGPTSPQLWATPDAGLLNDGESPETFKARQVRLEAKHHNSNGAGTPLGQQVGGKKRLNWRFVAWLMNWPAIALTDSDSSATEWSHYRQRMQSALSWLVGR